MKEKFKDDKQGTETENDTLPRGDADTAMNTGENMNAGAVAAEDEVEKLRAELQEMKDKYLRLVAEFENYRKRTAREGLELRQTAGKEVIVSLLEVLDDSDRAEKQLQTETDIAVVKEGVMLVFNKLRNILQLRGLKPMQSIGQEF